MSVEAKMMEAVLRKMAEQASEINAMGGSIADMHEQIQTLAGVVQGLLERVVALESTRKAQEARICPVCAVVLDGVFARGCNRSECPAR